jgi:23S rRNA (adenine2503-C2)-methyltransferase
MIDLKELSVSQLREFIASRGLPSYRVDQLIHWIYEQGAASLEEVTVFSKNLRKELSSVARIGNLRLITSQTSRDGTQKFLFSLEDGETIESVLIPDGNRLTLCISSQVGCAMGCRFCLTGRIGLKRNLKAHEILDQVLQVSRLIRPMRLTNIVLMGMGEPLHNIDEVSEALRRITELMKISRRRITLSTAGYLPGFTGLTGKAPLVNLAVSLNATTDKARNLLMPINRKYPIRELLAACRTYPLERRKRITFEYIMISGINDTPEDAERLHHLLKGIPAKVNLIPLNRTPEIDLKPSPEERVFRFQESLLKKGMTVIIRKSKGSDILAACGQLRAEYRS